MKLTGPVIIGGIGGSGTRVVASILQNLNIFIGSDIIATLDNITYTYLFKRPKWYYRNRDNTRQIKTGISIMEKSMTKTTPYSIKEFMFLLNATSGMARYGHNIEKDGTGKWAFQRLNHILFNRQKNLDNYSGWGWKEANSHHILKDLNNYFDNMKYIHTIRHGLDMAYSKTQQQLFIWGPMFDIPIPRSKEEIPEASFRYWVEVNRRAITIGKELGQDRFYLLNFDELCTNPESEIPRLIEFIGIKADQEQIDKAINIPKTPKTKGRFKSHDLSCYKTEDLEFLESIGFNYR